MLYTTYYSIPSNGQNALHARSTWLGWMASYLHRLPFSHSKHVYLFYECVCVCAIEESDDSIQKPTT